MIIQIEMTTASLRNTSCHFWIFFKWWLCSCQPYDVSLRIRVVFTREKNLHFVCSLLHGNHSDSNNPLTKMHTLTHIGHLKYNVQKSMKSSIKFNLMFLVIVFVLNHLNLAQIMVFFCHLCHKIDQKCKISAKLGWFNTNIIARNIKLNFKVDIHWISNVVF